MNDFESICPPYDSDWQVKSKPKPWKPKDAIEKTKVDGEGLKHFAKREKSGELRIYTIEHVKGQAAYILHWAANDKRELKQAEMF